jgi:hypothetical protein
MLAIVSGTPRKHFREISKIAVPMKIRIFLWQLVRKRLPSNDNVHRRHGPSNGRCAMCDEFEDTSHIFFRCPLAKFMWSAVRELLVYPWNPSYFADVICGLVIRPGNPSAFLQSAALPCVGHCGTRTSLQSKGCFHPNLLMVYIKC